MPQAPLPGVKARPQGGKNRLRLWSRLPAPGSRFPVPNIHLGLHPGEANLLPRADFFSPPTDKILKKSFLEAQAAAA